VQLRLSHFRCPREPTSWRLETSAGDAEPHTLELDMIGILSSAHIYGLPNFISDVSFARGSRTEHGARVTRGEGQKMPLVSFRPPDELPSSSQQTDGYPVMYVSQSSCLNCFHRDKDLLFLLHQPLMRRYANPTIAPQTWHMF